MSYVNAAIELRITYNALPRFTSLLFSDSESNTFILATDADVKFTPESVIALIDLMMVNTSVGAVCARTHPLGAGPIVWYQKFEYAIGHWFQKVRNIVSYCSTTRRFSYQPVVSKTVN